jgi:hypothetical protein
MAALEKIFVGKIKTDGISKTTNDPSKFEMLKIGHDITKTTSKPPKTDLDDTEPETRHYARYLLTDELHLAKGVAVLTYVAPVIADGSTTHKVYFPAGQTHGGTGFLIGESHMMTVQHVGRGYQVKDGSGNPVWLPLHATYGFCFNANSSYVEHTQSTTKGSIRSDNFGVDFNVLSPNFDYEIFACKKPSKKLFSGYTKFKSATHTLPDGGLKCSIVGCPKFNRSTEPYLPKTLYKSIYDNIEQRFLMISENLTYVVHQDAKFLYVISDTEAGDSGAPVFDTDGNIIGLYHGLYYGHKVRVTNTFPPEFRESLEWETNIAVRIEKIFKDIYERDNDFFEGLGLYLDDIPLDKNHPALR